MPDIAEMDSYAMLCQDWGSAYRITRTLAPPAPTDHPIMSAAAAWTASSPHSPLAQYDLFLARFTSKYPASPNPDGSFTPLEDNVLAWVVYQAPLDPTCGLWGVTAYNALTGQRIDAEGYSGINAALAPAPS